MNRHTAASANSAAVVVLALLWIPSCAGHPAPDSPAAGTEAVRARAQSPAARPAVGVALELPPDLAFAANPDAPAPVTFRHATHVDESAPRCTGCHPATHKILRRGGPVTHADMEAGRSCGACHDGKAAFAATDSDACEFCHQPPAVAAATAPTGGRR